MDRVGKVTQRQLNQVLKVGEHLVNINEISGRVRCHGGQG